MTSMYSSNDWPANLCNVDVVCSETLVSLTLLALFSSSSSSSSSSISSSSRGGDSDGWW